nr:hypothetical protein [Tanacetum cinerariifolium]
MSRPTTTVTTAPAGLALSSPNATGLPIRLATPAIASNTPAVARMAEKAATKRIRQLPWPLGRRRRASKPSDIFIPISSMGIGALTRSGWGGSRLAGFQGHRELPENDLLNLQACSQLSRNSSCEARERIRVRGRSNQVRGQRQFGEVVIHDCHFRLLHQFGLDDAARGREVAGGAGIFDQRAAKAVILGRAHGGADAGVTHETADDQVESAPAFEQAVQRRAVVGGDRAVQGVGQAFFDNDLIVLGLQLGDELPALTLWIEHAAHRAQMTHVDDGRFCGARGGHQLDDVVDRRLNTGQGERAAEVFLLGIDDDQRGITQSGRCVFTATELKHGLGTSVSLFAGLQAVEQVAASFVAWMAARIARRFFKESAVITSRLRTLRDHIRWAVSRFHGEDLFFGHGTDNAWDEARQLVLGALHLPWEIADSYLDCNLEDEELVAVQHLIKRRIEERVPTAYLLGEAWFCGMSFIVDERVLIPRSPIGCRSSEREGLVDRGSRQQPGSRRSAVPGSGFRLAGIRAWRPRRVHADRRAVPQPSGPVCSAGLTRLPAGLFPAKAGAT